MYKYEKIYVNKYVAQKRQQIFQQIGWQICKQIFIKICIQICKRFYKQLYTRICKQKFKQKPGKKWT